MRCLCYKDIAGKKNVNMVRFLWSVGKLSHTSWALLSGPLPRAKNYKGLSILYSFWSILTSYLTDFRSCIFRPWQFCTYSLFSLMPIDLLILIVFHCIKEVYTHTRIHTHNIKSKTEYTLQYIMRLLYQRNFHSFMFPFLWTWTHSTFTYKVCPWFCHQFQQS